MGFGERGKRGEGLSVRPFYSIPPNPLKKHCFTDDTFSDSPALSESDIIATLNHLSPHATTNTSDAILSSSLSAASSLCSYINNNNTDINIHAAVVPRHVQSSASLLSSSEPLCHYSVCVSRNSDSFSYGEFNSHVFNRVVDVASSCNGTNPAIATSPSPPIIEDGELDEGELNTIIAISSRSRETMHRTVKHIVIQPPFMRDELNSSGDDTIVMRGEHGRDMLVLEKEVRRLVEAWKKSIFE